MAFYFCGLLLQNPQSNHGKHMRQIPIKGIYNISEQHPSKNVMVIKNKDILRKC
jgi:hypothetical protein